MSSPSLIELRRQIAGTAAFRLTLRFAVIFVASLLVLGLVSGFGVRWLVASDLRDDVSGAIEEIAEAVAEGGEAGLAQALADIAADDDEILIGILAPDGALLAGSLAPPEIIEGWSELLPPGTDEDETLWVRTARLPDGRWAVAAASSETYHDVVELMGAGAVWTVVIALPLALLSGALLSVSVLRRLASIAETAESVGKGELNKRAPVSRRQDEFDRLAGAINAMLDRIEGLHRNLHNVTVGVAHELRTPLARARNRLTELREGGIGPGAETDIDCTVAEIDGLLTTFDALLKIGQIETEVERRGFHEIDLSALASEIAADYEPVIAERGKRLVTRIEPGLRLAGDRALLTQMISNLLENAIEHTPERTRIGLSLIRDAEGPTLVVEDDGPGIPAADGERIFERFQRLEKSRDQPGSGLGLSLVRSICGLHGFRVRVSPAAPGARFEVTM